MTLTAIAQAIKARWPHYITPPVDYIKLAHDAAPLTLAEIRQWLRPLRIELERIAETGEVNTQRGYPVTSDNDPQRLDWCINGFTVLLDNLGLDINTKPLEHISKSLENGWAMTREDIQAALQSIADCETSLQKIPSRIVKDIARDTEIAVHIESLIG